MPEEPKKRRWVERLPEGAQNAYHDLAVAAREILPFWQKTKALCRKSWETVFSDAKEAGPGSLPNTVHQITEKAHNGAGKGKVWARDTWKKAAPKIKASCKIVAEDVKEGEPLDKAKGACHKAMDGIEKCCHKCTDKVKELVTHGSGGKEE